MELNWRNVIEDPNEIQIFEALEDERWEWRTVPALVQESNLDEKKVRKILAKYPVFVRKSQFPSKTGEDLFSLRSRHFRKKGLWTFISSGTTPST